MLAYLIEIKRGNIVAENHIGIFASAYLFFPKLAQGPIERPQNILPQFHLTYGIDYIRILAGLKLLLWGLFKKLVIADRLAIYVNAVYNNYEQHSGTTLTVATVFYSFQIYADFSGYTDMALGTAQIFGFNLTNNFRRPYFSVSVKEFWNRWHISLSTWLRDYLFLPLAYSLTRKLKNEKYFLIPSTRIIYMIAIIFTFAICGIWHGEGINYLLWGLFFGISLTYANWTEKFSKKIRKSIGISKNSFIYQVIKILSNFTFVSFAWIFFRSDSTAMAFEIIKKIFSDQGTFFMDQPSNMIYSFFGIVFFLAIELKQEFMTKSNLPYESVSWFKEQLFYGTLILIILMIGVFDGGQFIYFQF